MNKFSLYLSVRLYSLRTECFPLTRTNALSLVYSTLNQNKGVASYTCFYRPKRKGARFPNQHSVHVVSGLFNALCYRSMIWLGCSATTPSFNNEPMSTVSHSYRFYKTTLVLILPCHPSPNMLPTNSHTIINRLVQLPSLALK